VITTSEVVAGGDLNGDGDPFDEVAQLCDASTGSPLVESLELAAWQVALSETTVAVAVSEKSHYDADRNGEPDGVRTVGVDPSNIRPLRCSAFVHDFFSSDAVRAELGPTGARVILSACQQCKRTLMAAARRNKVREVPSKGRANKAGYSGKTRSSSR